jgi:hypothetical protein
VKYPKLKPRSGAFAFAALLRASAFCERCREEHASPAEAIA